MKVILHWDGFGISHVYPILFSETQPLLENRAKISQTNVKQRGFARHSTPFIKRLQSYFLPLLARLSACLGEAGGGGGAVRVHIDLIKQWLGALTIGHC